MKTKRTLPPIVQFARLAGDKAALSRLGRAGAMRKNELRVMDAERKLGNRLASARQMAFEANEHICPVD